MMFAHHPLEADDRLGSIQIPVSFFYGDRDWMYRVGNGLFTINKNKYKNTHSN
jgi:hypothetical protein